MSIERHSSVRAKLTCCAACISMRTLKLAIWTRDWDWRKVESMTGFIADVTQQTILSAIWSQTASELEHLCSGVSRLADRTDKRVGRH